VRVRDCVRPVAARDRIDRRQLQELHMPIVPFQLGSPHASRGSGPQHNTRLIGRSNVLEAEGRLDRNQGRTISRAAPTTRRATGDQITEHGVCCADWLPGGRPNSISASPSPDTALRGSQRSCLKRTGYPHASANRLRAKACPLMRGVRTSGLRSATARTWSHAEREEERRTDRDTLRGGPTVASRPSFEEP
jgi:hypothetical protein